MADFCKITPTIEVMVFDDVDISFVLTIDIHRDNIMACCISFWIIEATC